MLSPSRISGCILGLALSVCGAAQAFDYPMQAEQVADGVYAVLTPSRDLPDTANGGWNSNSAFVVTGEGVLLFDTGSSTGIGRALARTIAGVTDQPVRWIVNSHGHGDHWLGNHAFADSVQVIYASPAVADEIKQRGSNWIRNFDRMTDGITGDSPILPPTRLVEARTQLTLGGRSLVLFPSGNSHSPGDLLLWLPDQRVLISGDVVYSDRMPSTNVSDLAQWITFIDELIALQPEVVVPGHGVVTDLDGLRRLQALLRDYRDAVQAGFEAGQADFEMVEAVVDALSDYAADYPGLAEKVRRDISHVYLQIEAAEFQ